MKLPRWAVLPVLILAAGGAFPQPSVENPPSDAARIPGAPRPPLLVMYGYVDPERVTFGPLWPDAATWVRGWRAVFQRFSVVTGMTTNAGLIEDLRARGTVFAFHVSNVVAATTGSHEDRVEQLVREWSEPFRDTLGGSLPGGFDGVSIDELHSSDDRSPEAAIVADALRELRARYPDKLIVAWAVWKIGLSRSAGWYGISHTLGRSYDLQLAAAEDVRALLVLESYINQANPQFDLMREIGANLTRRFPSLAARTILGLAISQTAPYNYNDRPQEDFGSFVAKQIAYIRSNAVLRQMPGVAFWAFYRASLPLIDQVCDLGRLWYPATP